MKTTKHTLVHLRPVAIILASLFATTVVHAEGVAVKNGNFIQDNSTASDYTSDSVALGNSHLSGSLGNMGRVPLKNAFAAGNSKVDYNANNSVALGNSSVDIHSQNAIAAGSSLVGKDASQSTAINNSTVGEGVKGALAAGESGVSSGGHFSVALSGSKIEGAGKVVRNSLATGQSEVTGKYSVALTESKVSADNSIGTNSSRIESGADGSVALVASRVGQGAANSVAIGNAQVSASSGVAIGRGALSGHKNSIALGAESQTDRANSVSVGNVNQTKNITHVSDGVEDTDAVNKRQLDIVDRKADQATVISQKASNDASNAVIQSSTALNLAKVTAKSLEKETQARIAGDADTLAAANAHSDASDVKTLASANAHTDSSVSSSNQRTDGLIAQEQKDRTRAIGTAKAEANRYTDGKVSASDQRTDELIQSEQQARVKGDAETLSAANQHSDANDRKILTSANGYTDQQTQGIEKRANTFTREREIATNQRTDQLMDTEVQARVDGDKRTLRAANDYTDWRVDGIEQKANNYTNQRFGELKRQVERNRKRADAGIAGAMAMTAIPKVDGKDVSFGMAMSGFRDQGAVAAGFNIQTSPNTAVKLNTAWDSQSGAGVAAGIAMGW